MSKKEKSIFEPEIPHVPAGWEVAPFQRVVSVVSDAGKRLKQRDYLVQGKIPVIDQGQDFIGGYTDDEGLAFDGNLPVVLFGDHTRAIKFVDKQFAVGAEGIKILQPASCYDPKFFYYLLTSLQIPSRGYSRHFQFLKKFSLPIAPLNQQIRIVAEIEKQFSRLDEAVANLKRVKANLKRYKAAVLKAAVEGKLTEVWRKQHPDVEPADKLLERILEERRANWQGRGKYKEPVAPDTSGLPELPEGWVWASVEQIAALVTDGDHNPPKRTASGVRHLTAKHVRDWRLDPEDCTYISRDDAAKVFKRYSPQTGDLIVTCVGTVGRTAIVPEGFEFSPDRNLAAVRLLPRLVNAKYVQVLFESPLIQEVIKGASGSTAQPHLYLSDLRTLSVPLPPLVEQNQVIAEVERRLSIIAEAEAQVDANLRRADRLRQSILKQAFSGQLVPQDPNDEPASVLLERVRANANVGARFIAPKARPEKPMRAQSIAPLRKTPQSTDPEGAIHELPLHAPPANSDFESLDAVIAAILDHMQTGREYSRANLVGALGLTSGRWNAAIQELKRRGQVRQMGEKSGARYFLS